jgi:hypothetical protein
MLGLGHASYDTKGPNKTLESDGSGPVTKYIYSLVNDLPDFEER